MRALDAICFHLVEVIVCIVIAACFAVMFALGWLVFSRFVLEKAKRRFAARIADGTVISFSVAVAVNVGFGFELLGGSTVTHAGAIVAGVAAGICFGHLSAVLSGLEAGIFQGTGHKMRSAIGFIALLGVLGGITGGIAKGTVFGFAISVVVGATFGISLAITFLRAYYHAIHLLFVWPSPAGRHYPYHPVAWDDLCSLPFPRMDQLLVAYAEAVSDAGTREIQRLIDEYPSQRIAALKANTCLIARQCGREGA